MNIFVLDISPKKAAEYHCDKHVVKMILETAQLLNNARVACGLTKFMETAHVKHPCSLWVSEGGWNYTWLATLGHSLLSEYSYRYGKIHKLTDFLESCYFDIPSKIMQKSDFKTPFRLCMPDDCKVDSALESYRNYYRTYKRHIAKWSFREEPEWWNI